VILGFLIAAGCSHAPTYDDGQIEAIMRPLAYEQEIDRKCEAQQSVFDADLFVSSLSGQSAARASEILSSVSMEVAEGEAEYVCTVELYFSTQQRANDARAMWKALKGNS
jgi:hypothetical protein